MRGDGLLTVHQQARVELANGRHRRPETPADHHREGREHALRQSGGVLGGEHRVVDSDADPDGVEQAVARIPRHRYRFAGGADG